MLNTSNNNTIKVFSFGSPFYHQFQQLQFSTVAEFQNKLKECFSIDIPHQILIKDRQIVTLTSQVPFAQLKINSQTALLLIAKPKEPINHKQKNNLQHETKVILQLQKLQNSVFRAKEREKNRLLQIQIRQKMLYCAQKKAIDSIINHFIKKLKLPNPQLLLLNQPKLKFILSKIAKDNPRLLKLLLTRIKTVKRALIDRSLLKKQCTIESRIIGEQVRGLVKLGYAEEKAVKALQISKNQMESAIQLLYNGQLDAAAAKDVLPIRKWSILDEYQHVLDWLSKEKKVEIILLKNKVGYLAVYLNSLKHTVPQMFQMLCRWQAFLPAIISHLYEKIIRQK